MLGQMDIGTKGNLRHQDTRWGVGLGAHLLQSCCDKTSVKSVKLEKALKLSKILEIEFLLEIILHARGG